jgi:two-component system sensor histidine kinase FlrB
VVVLDGTGQVKYCNPAAMEILGESPRGAAWSDVVARIFFPRLDDGHDISLRCGRRVNVSTQALQGEPGQILLIHEVTETRRLQEQLNRHKRLSAQGEMAAALAHQVRTPLSCALLYLSNLGQPGLDRELRQRFMDKAFTCLKDLERLMNDMLLYARSGGFEMEEIGLESLLDNLVRQAEPMLTGIRFDLTIRRPLPDVILRANPAALRSAMLNLVHNAIQSCGETGTLRIEAGMENDQTLVLAFTDNGPGIPEEIRREIFEPFKTTRSHGTGLGLAIVHAVVRAHRGEIWLDSGHASGTSFKMRFPVAMGSAAPERMNQTAPWSSVEKAVA